MTLRHKILIYLALMHVVLLALAMALFRADPLWLLVSELGFLLSLSVGWYLVRRFFVPLELIRTGTDLLQESDFTTRFVETGQQEMDALIRVYNSMADTLREERLRVQEQSSLTLRIVQSMPTAVVVCDFDGRIEMLNPAAERLAGDAEVVGRKPEELEGHLPFGALGALGAGASAVVSAGARRFRCARIDVHDRSFGRSWYLVDELTRELRASEKAAYETLIRTISHEVNNSVGAISSMLESHRSLDESERIRQIFRISSARLRNLSSFVNDYAELVRIPPPDLRPADLNEVVADVLSLYGTSEGIVLRHDLANDLPAVRIDRNQIEQALINILKNAFEAIGLSEGVVSVCTTADHHRILLEVSDTGPGVERSELLFTPFYSTRTDGRGLGLTVVTQILENHGFDFSLENAPDGGARFTIAILHS